MVASWIALEDVAEEAGPLSYYPGSHKIPPYRFSDGGIKAIDEEMAACREYVEREIRERGLTPAVFRPQAGDVLLWHAQLYHGGLPIKDPSLTRTSVVTHYFRYQDTEPRRCREFAPGRYFMKRPHQTVEG
jgi:ectoine hydroxylase-related dioxygenase (phytanoyl-CoA dioxygenase family)